MIPARRSPLFTRFFAYDAERRLARSFEAVQARGLDALARAAATGPTLVVTNHTSWWDPLIALFVTARLLRVDAYALMDAANLARLPFFALVGAFGVDRSDPADGAAVVRYAARLLRERRALVWIFAQGEEVPITARPLAFRPGSAEIARLGRATTIAGALRYEMGSAPRPVAWLSFEAMREPPTRAGHEAAVACELDRLDRAIIARDGAGFTRVCSGERGRGFQLAERALAWMTRRALG